MSLILLLSSFNVATLFISICLISMISGIFFLDAPFPFMETLSVNFIEFEESEVINLLLNSLSYFFSLSDRVIVNPINGWGIFAIILSKSVIYILIGNYL